jgi:hypothetical protein
MARIGQETEARKEQMSIKMSEKERQLERIEKLLEDEDPREYGAVDIGGDRYDTIGLVQAKIRNGKIRIGDGLGDWWIVDHLTPSEIVLEMREYAEEAREG